MGDGCLEIGELLAQLPGPVFGSPVSLGGALRGARSGHRRFGLSGFGRLRLGAQVVFIVAPVESCRTVSYLDYLVGKTIDEALKISNKLVVEALDGLPPVKVHCSVLGEDALKSAINDYLINRDGKGLEGWSPRNIDHEH